MIQNGKDKKLSDAPKGLPNMGAALARLLQTATIGLICKTNVGGFLQETEQLKTVKLVRQPLSATALSIKPEGERAWRWNTFHMDTAYILKTDDRFMYKGIPYRVMEVSDFREYGYMMYGAIEDYRSTT